MENSVPDAFEKSEVGDKSNGQSDRSRRLDYKRGCKNEPYKTNYSADLRQGERITYCGAFVQAYFSVSERNYRYYHRNNAESAYLYKQHYYELTEKRPFGSRIDDYESRNANRRNRRKKRIGITAAPMARAT